ncbi:hypothetical protein [Chitinophaga ginsengisoli]|uniref:Uncharacterized protein n=1 Tax=Chitinophaga ginsengisoli TaxID=363837 RepID=A0A2P8FXC1_9BACT|nr:hypothetical protein [Chitinophaga ginsengisoli]PSL26364.1 hypothetical protein CLV42_11175 [Chitinophaga ginsengisoli]
MRQNWIVSLIAIWMIIACNGNVAKIDGKEVENAVLTANDLSKDYSFESMLDSVIEDVNCAVFPIVNKKIVFQDKYASMDTSQILVIPFSPNGKNFKSSAYSNIKSRYILINPGYIKEFAMKNTLNDATSVKPLLELMILHEIGHFILQRTGAFDAINDGDSTQLGEQQSNLEPEFITSEKKVELEADSLAIVMVRKQKVNKYDCLNVEFNIELLVPAMQFQMSGKRMIDNFGASDIGFLHDPNSSHPNMELRITFMNYFLYPTATLKGLIDDYIYNRTVRPVHNQLLDPRIYQGLEKHLPDDSI